MENEIKEIFLSLKNEIENIKKVKLDYETKLKRKDILIEELRKKENINLLNDMGILKERIEKLEKNLSECIFLLRKI